MCELMRYAGFDLAAAMLHFPCNRRARLDDKRISAMYYDLVAPEGGGGDYGSDGGGYDQLGFGTLMYAK